MRAETSSMCRVCGEHGLVILLGMGWLSPTGVRTILARHAHPVPVFVETGTHNGTTLYAIHEAGIFDQLHSIELSDVFFGRALQHCVNLDGFGTKLVLHRGDSARVVPALAPTIGRPTFFWLDAHWYPEEHVAETAPMPLFEELEAIAARKRPDVVVIDDVQCFARQWSEGPGGDWSHVTQEKILAVFGSRVVQSYVEGFKFCLHLGS